MFYTLVKANLKATQHNTASFTAQKLKYCIKDFVSKCAGN